MINNPRFEQALIGTVMRFPTEAGSVTDVQPQDMVLVSHQNLWTIILDLEHRGGLSYQAIVERLYSADQMNSLGADVEDGDVTGEAYLKALIARGAQESIRDFANHVVSDSTKRNLHTLAHLMALDAESQKDAEELLDKAEEQLYKLRRSRVDTGEDIADLLSKYEQNVEDWMSGKIKPAFTFHTPGLRRLVPFLEPTDFMLIAGRPGEGKSSILREEAFEAAKRGQKVVMFNLENSPLEYARYLISYDTGINTELLREPTRMTERQREQARAAGQRLKALPLKIVSLGAPSVFEITRIARKLIVQGWEIIMVDYIQLVKNGIENEVQDITMTSSMLRGFALKHNVPVIANAQLNRELTKRAVGSPPQLQDLRGSGSLEQDAVIVTFTSLLDMTEAQLRQYTQNVNSDGTFTLRAVPMRMYCQKNRNGPTGVTPPFLWEKHTNRFFAMTTEPTERAVRQAPRQTQRASQPELA